VFFCSLVHIADIACPEVLLLTVNVQFMLIFFLKKEKKNKRKKDKKTKEKKKKR